MEQYKIIQSYTDEQLKTVNFDELYAEAVKLDKENLEIYERIKEIRNNIKQNLLELYHPKHRIFMYFDKNVHFSMPRSQKNRIDDFKDRLKDVLNKEQKVIKDKEIEDNQKKLLEKAILFLQAHDKILGVDFTLDTAIYFANDIRFEELVEEAKKKDTLYSFNGDQNCEECCGWDGNNRRCSCGNRRVEWCYDGDFTDMYIYGEAY